MNAPAADSEASTRPLGERLALGVLCGVLALAVNQVGLPFISAESPAFVFGGAFVLFAFRVLGPAPGVLAAAIGYAAPSGNTEFAGLQAVVYAVEGWAVARLAMRTRSLAVSELLFWLTGGAFADALVYVWWVGLTPGLVLLLVIKQMLNGVMYAVMADGALRIGALRRSLQLAPKTTRTWQQVLFDRSVPLVMVPMTIIVLLLARASLAAVQSRVAGELRQAAMSAERGTAMFLQSRLLSLEGLRSQVAMLPAGASARADSLLAAFLTTHREFLNVYLADANGIVQSAAPLGSSDGVPLRGRDISRRPYFAEVRTSGRPVFSDLVIGSLHVRQSGPEPVIPVALPVAPSGTPFRGVLMGAMDATTLGPIIGARVRTADAVRAGTAQVLDRTGRVVVSASSEWVTGSERASELEGLLEGNGEARQVVSSVVAGPADAARYGPRLTITQMVANFPFLVLVDEPLATVHRDLIPTSLGLIVLLLAALLAVYVVPRTLGDQLSDPLQAIGAVAETLASGKPVPRGLLDRFESSPVHEIHTLGAELQRMDDALVARREADAQAMQQSESRYRETLEQLAQAQKMEGIGRLAGGIAHDFNNLLTPIVGYTDLALAAVPSDSPARRDLSLVRTAAGKAKEVVSQLLAFGRAQVLDTKRVDLAEIVLEFEPLLRKSLGVSHDLVVSTELGVVVEADKAKVQQVLMNLVLNAADAMPKGGRVDVRVGVETVGASDPSDPEPLPAGQYGVVVVQDHGVGMDEQTKQRAFDPFFTTKPRGKGTGLGLSTAYGIVRQHRGTINVKSAPGVGTEMRVLLPLLVAGQVSTLPPIYRPEKAVLEAALATLPPSTETPRTVLLVEDEGPVRDMVREALARQGYRVLAAREGDEALTRAAAHEGRIDLLLTDVLLPGVNGREVARRFRIARPDARVLFMSGYSADVLSEQEAAAGDAALLVKPFTPDELAQRVSEALARPY